MALKLLGGVSYALLGKAVFGRALEFLLCGFGIALGLRGCGLGLTFAFLQEAIFSSTSELFLCGLGVTGLFGESQIGKQKYGGQCDSKLLHEKTPLVSLNLCIVLLLPGSVKPRRKDAERLDADYRG